MTQKAVLPVNEQREFAFIDSHPDIYGDVRQFHRKFVPHRVPARPTFIPEVGEFRLKFLTEELKELADATASGDLVEVADAIGDLVYVAIGYALSCGIPFPAVWAEIQRSNMEKEVPGPDHPERWKYCVKPANWTAPRVAAILEECGYVAGETIAMESLRTH